MNSYLVGDNMALLADMGDQSIDFIYFDPPYNTGRDFSDFNDKFESMQSYSFDFLKPRIEECRRVLKKDGNILIHVEPRCSHRVRIVLDEVFGEDKFKNEICWVTGGNAKNKTKLNRYHDTLMVYGKSRKSKFNPMYKPYDEVYKKSSSAKMCEFRNEWYITTAIHNSQPHINPRPNLQYEWHGHKKQWYASLKRMKKLHNDNRLKYNKKGIPRIKRYLSEMEGIPIRDVWDDINNVQSPEKLDYATQKPVKLLERILKMYTNDGDLVLDIFAGSGTTGRAAIKCNRNYILIDINQKGKEIFKSSLEEE